MASTRLIGLFTLAATAVAAAQIPVNQEPRHRVTFESALLRILDVRIPAADMSLDHRHDFDVVTISMNGGTNTRSQSTGQAWGPVRPPRPLGDAAITDYTGKPGSHRVENVGASLYQLFVVENLRPGGWSAAAAAAGLGTTVAAESRAFRIYDVRLGRETVQTSHTHAVPTVVVLIGGTVMSDGPDTHAKAYAPAAVGLKQLTATGQWVLVPPGDTHHMVRLGAADARVVEIEVR
jgi:hypothetical protein